MAAQVLLLDEPTAALDPKSSALVSQALEEVLAAASSLAFVKSAGAVVREPEEAPYHDRLGPFSCFLKSFWAEIVAHDLRLGAVQRADQIVVMDRGRILERGRHKDLLELDGSYKRLMDDQRLPTEHTPRI